jgi:flagellar motor switch protein FliG
MSNAKSTVATVYGHNKTIDRIAVSLFDRSDNETNATTYCETINSLELKGDSWLYAKIISENEQYSLDAFLPVNFQEMIMKLDNIAIQNTLREVDAQELAKALKGEGEAISEKFFSNMSKRASKMLKDDIRCMRPSMIDIRKIQEKILMVIRHLERIGEIVITDTKGEAK